MAKTQEYLLAPLPNFPLADVNFEFLKLIRDQSLAIRMKFIKNMSDRLTKLDHQPSKYELAMIRADVKEKMDVAGDLDLSQFNTRLVEGNLVPFKSGVDDPSNVAMECFKAYGITADEWSAANNFGIQLAYIGESCNIEFADAVLLGCIRNDLYFGEFITSDGTVLITKVGINTRIIQHRAFRHKTLMDTDIDRSRSDPFTHMAIRAHVMMPFNTKTIQL